MELNRHRTGSFPSYSVFIASSMLVRTLIVSAFVFVAFETPVVQIKHSEALDPLARVQIPTPTP